MYCGWHAKYVHLENKMREAGDAAYIDVTPNKFTVQSALFSALTRATEMVISMVNLVMAQTLLESAQPLFRSQVYKLAKRLNKSVEVVVFIVLWSPRTEEFTRGVGMLKVNLLAL
jgi:hypothetical protein